MVAFATEHDATQVGMGMVHVCGDDAVQPTDAAAQEVQNEVHLYS